MDKELDLETLDNVVAGVSHEVGENAGLNNANLYRKQQIDMLKREREELKKLGKDTDEMSVEELDHIHAGMSRR